MLKHKWMFGSAVLSVLAVALMAVAQDEIEPRQSPYAEVMQRIHTTDVKITYHRPAVKDREIWGELVKYETEKPWRAGANEATTFSVSKDVEINGETLEAGTYSFYAFVTEDEWTLVFNTVAETWGSYDYDAAKDALRVEVTPEEDDHQEWLRYGFEDLEGNSAVAFLKWEELKVPFTIVASN